MNDFWYGVSCIVQLLLLDLIRGIILSLQSIQAERCKMDSAVFEKVLDRLDLFHGGKSSFQLNPIASRIIDSNIQKLEGKIPIIKF